MDLQEIKFTRKVIKRCQMQKLYTLKVTMEEFDELQHAVNQHNQNRNYFTDKQKINTDNLIKKIDKLDFEVLDDYVTILKKRNNS